MVKNVVTSDKNIKKAVELYGQDKVNATLAKQGAKGATVTNTSTNTVVPPAPTTPISPPTPIAPKQNVIDSINALKSKQVSSTPAITAEPIQPAPVEPTPAPTPAPVQPTPEPAKVETPAPATPTPTAPKEPVKSPRQILAENLTLEQTKNNLAKYRTGQELYNAIQGNLIKEGTREYNNLAQANPDLVNQYKTYKQDQVKKETINTLGNVVLGNQIESKPVKTSDQFLEYFAQGLDDDLASTYAQNVTNNPEYLKAVNTLDNINAQIAENNKSINALYTDVRASLSSSTPESMVASRIAREAKPLIEQGMYLAELAQNAESSMNRIYDANKENFDMQMQDRNQKRNLAFQLYGTIRAEEIRQEDIIAKEEELKMAMEQAKSEQEYLQYKDERDYNLKVAEAMQKAGQWEADYDLKAAEFDLKANEANRFKASDYLKTTITGEDGSTKEVFVNPTTGQQIDPAQAFGEQASGVDLETVLSGYSPKGQELLMVPDGTVIPTRLGKVSPQNAEIRGKECAEYVNDIAGTKMGNTYKSKTDICTEPTGGIGSVVAWKPQGSGIYGHTGIKVGEDENYEYIKSSNYVPGTVTTEAIPKGTIKNYYTPESVKQAQEQANQVPIAKKYANGNVRTADGILYDKKEVAALNKDIVNNDNYKAIIVSQNLEQNLKNFEEKFQKYGTEVGLDKLKIGSSAATELKSTYTDLMLTAKEFFNLGVLNGPDLAILVSRMPSPVDFVLPSSEGKELKVDGTMFNNKVQSGIDTMRQMIKRKLENDYTTVNSSFGEFGDTIPALANAKRIYGTINQSADQSAESDVNSYYN